MSLLVFAESFYFWQKHCRLQKSLPLISSDPVILLSCIYAQYFFFFLSFLKNTITHRYLSHRKKESHEAYFLGMIVFRV